MSHPGPHASSPAPLLDVDALASWLAVSKKTIYRWAEFGDGPSPCHVGRLLRWRREDVERWLDQQQSAGGQP